MSVLLALALQAATADPGIVVSSRKLEDAYAECLADKCTPLRDAQVSIAWAEQRFREGAYVKAKNGLSAAVARNRDTAASDPKPLAALYEARATVAIQDGDREMYQQSVGGRLRTLRDHVAATDPAVAAAELAVGDMWVKLRDIRQADAAYRTAQEHAAARGQASVAQTAAVRRAWLAIALDEENRAQAILDEVAAAPGEPGPAVQSAMRSVRLRLAAKRGDDATAERLVAEIAASRPAEPVLVQAASYTPTPIAAAADGARAFQFNEPVQMYSADRAGIKWADVGYWIRPDGTVDGIEVLRGSPARSWTDPVLEQVASRRYAPSVGDVAGQGTYRIERFTLRPTYRVPIGSLVKRRSGPERLESIELTAEGTRVVGTE